MVVGIDRFNMKKTIFLSILGLFFCGSIFFFGFFLGKKKSVNKTVFVEKQGKITRDTINTPMPYEVYIKDTIPIILYKDTSKLNEVLQDYYTVRNYNLDFSNDTIGTYKVITSISKNKLISATSEIQPKIYTMKEKEIITKVPNFQFWFMVGTSFNLSYNKVQIGLDVKNFKLGVSGLRIEKQLGYTIDFGYKF